MKSIKHLLLLLVIVFFSIKVHSQPWKQYSDSARASSDQKKMDKAIEYYIKANEELQKDSMQTNSHAQICTSLAVLYLNMGQYAKAEPLYLEARQIWEKVLGKEHLNYAKSCINLAILYSITGQNEKAELLYLEGKNKTERVLGKEHPDYASIINNLAMLYMNMGQLIKAEPLFLDARKIREKVQGKEHPDYATSCGNLAILYMYMGQYEKAELLYLEAKKILEKVFSNEHAEYAKSCVNLAILYMYVGQYEKAEALYLAAKKIVEKVYGKEHPDYAKICDNLGSLYATIGQYKKAEPLWLTTRQIREKALGMEHPDYAKSCGNLAILYMNMGQYEKAEPLYLESKKILEKAFGKENPDYATSIDNLASLYKNMGQYEKVEPFYLEAKQIREKVLGKMHPNYATSINNLANFYSDIGQYEKAEPLYLEARQVREKAQGKEHPDYATSIDNLADLYTKMRQYEKAEPLMLEARQLREKALGKDHPDYAVSCNNLALLYSHLGRYNKAESLDLEAKNIREKALGKSHPEYTATCNNLAILYRNMHNIEKANYFYVEASKSKNVQLKEIFQFTSEVEKQSYLKQNSHYENSFFSFYSADFPHAQQGFSYAVSLFNRNLVLSSLQNLRQAIYYANDTLIRNKYNSWVDTREQISYWQTKPIAKRTVYAANLQEQANTLEKDLTRLSIEFKNQQERKEIEWKIIQKSLQPNEAAIEFVTFNYFDGKRWTDSNYYIALLLRKDKPEPMLVQLFEKKQLATLLSRTENLATNNRINALYNTNRSLYNLTWKPLEKYLKGISKIYFASAGDLFKISFAALLVNDKQVLSDKYQLIQLNTTATVTDTRQSFISASDKIQLYGGVQYDADSSTLMQAVSRYQTGIASSCSLPRDLPRGAGVQYLPGTLREVESVKKQAGITSTSITVLSGINATEESIKALSGKASPSVLHIATHGFFFSDPKEDKRDSLLQKGESSGKVFRQSDNPLFRSGLLFAGANNAWQGKSIEGMEDGILTAYEVSNMYLPNTKLVVLSACETALGDIQGSEGVYGLQRAFKMAGVQNLVMSLWKIGDGETAEFMQQFYKNLFSKQSVNDAFYNAQAIMKNKYWNEPYKWAAWVLIR